MVWRNDRFRGASGWARAALSALCVALLCVAAGHAQNRSPWSKAAPFPEPQEELYGVAANGKIYVIGGFHGGPSGINYEYDPATDKWTKKKPMPVPAHHQSMVEYHGKIYVFAGYISDPIPGQGLAGWQPIDNSWEYDPATDNWRALAPLPGKRGSTVAVEVGGKIYVIGGGIPEPGTNHASVLPSRAARSVGTNEAYDPETNTWETHSPMPTPRNHAFAGAVNGKIYVIGGRISSPFITVASNLDIVEEYDPATDHWGTAKAQMPTPRSGGGWVTFGGKIYVAGGESQTRQMLGAYRAFEAYDPASNTWQVLPSMPLPRHGVAGAVLNNRIHLVSGNITSGGAPDAHVSTSSHDIYDPR